MKTVSLRFIAWLSIFAMLSGACGSPRILPTKTITLPSTVVPIPIEQPTENPSPTIKPSETPVPPTHEPSPIPPTLQATWQPITASSNGPVGFIADPQDGIGLTFYHLDGSLITEMLAPGLLEDHSQFVHFAGPWTGDLIDVPVAYFSTTGPSNRSEQAWFRLVAGDSEPILINIPDHFSMVGAPAQPVLAYSTLDFEESQPRSRLYAASLSTLPGAPPLFTIADPDGYFVRVLAVDAQAGELKGVWYTMSAWEVGGDIIFEPRKGLKYLDMTDGTVNEILNRDKVAWDVSLDRTWVAYSTLSGPISLLNRLTGETITYPLLPESNRGAGNARISPDGQSVAWLEACGWTMSEDQDFYTMIRIASTGGIHLVDIPQKVFDHVASAEKISWIEPVGWLNEQTLVVQARFEDWNHAALIRVNLDGSNPLYLASGTFVAFLFP